MRKLVLIIAVMAMAGILILASCAQPAAPAPSPTAKPAPAPSTAAPSPAPAPSPTPASSPSPTAKPAPKPIELKTAMAWAQSLQNNVKFLEWVKKANEVTKGEVVIKIVGGPEAVPFAEQVGALRRGMIDLVHTAGGYYTDVVPEVNALLLSQLSPPEERKSGYYDLMNKIHQEKGLFYLGRTNAGAPLGNIFINIQIKRPQDLAGLKIRSMPVYDPILKELKAVPVTIQQGDIYNAMQQRVIDGYIAPASSGIVSVGLHEVTKYIVSKTFYVNPAVVIANSDVWNKISEGNRKLLMDSFMDMEKTEVEYWTGVTNAEIDKAVKAGMKVIDFTPEDAQWLENTAYKLSWDVILAKSPQNTPKLKELSSKK